MQRSLQTCCTLLVLSALSSQSAMAQFPFPGPGEPDPPVIENFVAMQVGENTWQLGGQVVCSEPAYLTVTFGGLQTLLDGEDCVTDEYGNFSYTFILPNELSGLATAQATDGWGQESEVEEAFISD